MPSRPPPDIPDPGRPFLSPHQAGTPIDPAGVPVRPLPPVPAAPPDHYPIPTGADPFTGSEARELRRLIAEQARRKIEALYEPLPAQDEFHRSAARVRLLRGSNRGGKTLPAAVELARAVTARDPTGKYPARDGRAYVVGKDLRHIGEVIYRKLFRAGAFKIIRDNVTGEWRAYRPWQDRHRAKEAKPAPPLIPKRYVAELAWEKKAENIISKVVLTTGWEVNFFSSLGKPPQGMDLDLVWFDEEVVDGEWYPEMSARLLDRAGRFYWSATPQAGTDRLYELHLRCEREMEEHRLGGPAPAAREYLILLDDNPHIDADAKRAMAADLDDQAYAVRVGGEFAVLSSKVYPEYARKTHVVPYLDPPPHWTLYAAVDPGRQVCAALFLAVPPPGEAAAGERYLFDELYLPNCDAAEFGKKFAARVAGRPVFEAFLIDHRMGRQTEIGSGKTVEDQYAAALQANGVACRRTGAAFDWGSDDVAGGIEACRAWLRVAAGGPALRVVGDRCPNFLWEIERYRYKRSNGLVTDQPEDRGRVHAMACLRYLAMSDPRWVEPGAARPKARGAYAAYLRKRATEKRDRNVTLGPARKQS